MSGGLFVGVSGRRRRRLILSPEERSTHVHIIGASGEGKSKAMEHMIREDILERRGLCLIDPHGKLYGDILRWLATKRIKRKIIFFNPASDEWTVGFNPLKKTSKYISHQRDAMVKACAKVWGASDMDKTPLLKRILRDVIHVLLEKKMSLLEAMYLIDPINKEIRKYLAKDISDPVIRQEWEYFNQMRNPKDFYSEFSSTINRLSEFLGSDRIRRIFGQSHNSLDIRKIMDEGEILLVNLSSEERLSGESARMLGTLLVNDLFLNASERDPKTAKRAPFYLYIDEFSLFVNEDIRRILDEGRKFGLHLILAHQHLGQIEEDQNIYKAVMQDARTKLIFGGMMPEDAEKLAQHAYMGYLNPEAIKREISTTKERHIKTREQSITKAEGESVAQGRSWSDTVGSSSGESAGQTMRPGPDGEVIVEAATALAGTSQSSSLGGYAAKATNRSTSVSDVPFYDVEEYEEVTSVQYKDLSEQLYEVMSVMVNQPSRHCLLKAPKRPPVVLEIPFIDEGYAREERVKKYETGYLETCEFARKVEEADREIKASEQRLMDAVEEMKKEEEGPEPPENPEDYYEEARRGEGVNEEFEAKEPEFGEKGPEWKKEEGEPEAPENPEDYYE